LLGAKYLFNGAYTVIPAHKRGGAKCYGIVWGIGNAHLAGNYTWVANPPNFGKGIMCSSPVSPQNCSYPFMQNLHFPQLSLIKPAPTRSPILNEWTYSPVWTTTPNISWPGTLG
jgi:hypothetical protein